jgi:hypothetical protein
MNRFALLALLLFTAVPARAESRRALIIGIDEYSAAPLANPAPERNWTNLEGAVADAEAMKATLMSRYGFGEKDVVVLKNRDATRAAILAGLEKLVAQSMPGDVAVFYYAGHGSQVTNVASQEHDKLDETLVPWDSRSGASDIRDKELGGILIKVKERVQFTFIADSCHSGSITRGTPGTIRLRQIARDPKAQVNDPSRPDPSDRVLVLSAAQDYQPAAEATDPSGRPHGAFTASLLAALNSLPVTATSAAVFESTRERLKNRGFYQEPVFEGPAARKSAPFLGPRTRGASGAPIAAVVSVKGREVTLRAGTATGIGPGTVFVRAEPTRLRLVVRSVDFLTSVAEPLDSSAPTAAIEPGAIFELEKLAAPPQAALRVQLPTTAPDENAVVSAARELASLRAADVVWVDDPSKIIPTHVVQLDDHGWALHGPGGSVAPLGPSPRTADVNAALAKMPPSGSREAPCNRKPCLFVRLPPSKSVVSGLAIGKEPTDAIRAVEKDADSDYALVGRVGPKGGVEYAWVRLVAPPTSCRDASGKPLSGGASSCESRGGRMIESNAPPAATLPPRSEFFALNQKPPKGAAATNSTASALEEVATRIARVAALLNLKGPGEKDLFPYRLAIRKKGGADVATGGQLHEGAYELLLAADGDISQSARRRVYVLAVQSDGAIHVLYPKSGVENEFPPRTATPEQTYVLNGPQVDVGAPYGTDTLALLASADPVEDLDLLEQPAVLETGYRGHRGPLGLGALIVNEASRTRGFGNAATANWSVQRIEFETVP